MDRRRFLRTAGLAAASWPLARLLGACADPPPGEAIPTPVSTTTTTALVSSAAPATTSILVPTTPAASTATAAPPQAVPLGAICRDAWGARAPGSGLVPHTIERLTVHHTATLLDDNRRAPSRLRGHQRYHQSLGWPDLAYHVAVDAHGNVYAARATAARGDTATDYDPTGHFLVVAEGNFDEQPMPDAQLEGVAAVLAWAAAEFDVDPSTIRGHRDWASTTCPGAGFQPLIADGTLESMTDALLAAGGVELRVVCDDSAYAAVAAIEAGTPPPELGTPARFLLKDGNSAGYADRSYEFGERDWIPVSGDFGE